MVASQGLEPQQAESESAVLPLHHEASSTFLDWRGRRGSNPQPPDRQSSALTNCATTPYLESGTYYTIFTPSNASGNFIFLLYRGKSAAAAALFTTFFFTNLPRSQPHAQIRKMKRRLNICEANLFPTKEKPNAEDFTFRPSLGAGTLLGVGRIGVRNFAHVA